MLAVLAAPDAAAAPKKKPKAAPEPALTIPDCVHVSTTSARLRYKPDLDSVRDCQEKARGEAVAAAEAKGKPLSYQTLEEFDDLQRAEVRDYLANSGTIIDGETKSGRGLGGLTNEDLAKAGDSAGDLSSLEKRLHAQAGDGKDGITPAMGRDIVDSLMKKQGFISPDMKELLDAVVKDGGKLTPDTMKKLQGAAKAAKGAGLNLNIDAGTEKSLLEHDFDKDKDVPTAPPADPGNL
ncbi:MAG: hypothetical protein M0D55_02430 [Elusimicrobiota bacterium]|nr:MAG: hypothetical protein M0D55_02430 [Elusimicrobiota bacterium]